MSTTATKIPKPKVTTRMVFCFLGSRMDVRIGIGKKRIAKSVMMFAGAEERYMVMMSVHFAVVFCGQAYAALTGLHWTMVTMVSANPAALTTQRVAIVAHRKV